MLLCYCAEGRVPVFSREVLTVGVIQGNPRFPILIGEDKIVSFASGARPVAVT